MTLFSFHLAQLSLGRALKLLSSPPRAGNTLGLIHAECMTAMTLGSAILSPQRMLLRQVAVFAQWQDEAALDGFLTGDKLGRQLAAGWHTRLAYLRQWGHLTEFNIPQQPTEVDDPEAPVVAVTLARMKLRQVPRFIHWGRPVEKLVRDHPGTSLALAAIRLPNTVSTFTVWKAQKEMVGMVHGRSPVPRPKRHARAMQERERKDFHYQFTTLRFKPLAEYGQWQGRSRIIPQQTTTHGAGSS